MQRFLRQDWESNNRLKKDRLDNIKSDNFSLKVRNSTNEWALTLFDKALISRVWREPLGSRPGARTLWGAGSVSQPRSSWEGRPVFTAVSAAWGFGLLHILASFWCCQPLFLPILVGEKWCGIMFGFNFSPWLPTMLSTFSCVRWHFIASFVKCLRRSFAHLKLG